MLTQARPESGSLIVLPEMFDTGFSHDLEKILPQADHSLAFLQEMAKTHKAGVLAGVIADHGDGRGSNQAVYVDAEGKIGASYDKVHLFSLSGEADCCVAGDRISTFSVAGTCVAPLICYDLRFPEVFRVGLERGTEVFIVVANWPGSRWQHWTTLLKARAIENQAWVIGVNRVGKDPGEEYFGHSMVVDPWGTPIAKAASRDACLACDLDLALLHQCREKFPTLKDRLSDYNIL